MKRLLVLMLLVLLPVALAVNDPGHDSLYVLLTGDSAIDGSLNITGLLNASNIRVANLLYGDQIDIRGNGSIFTVSSRPAIQADSSDLYLDSTNNLYFATRGGTSGLMQIGPTTGSTYTLNVSGNILQQNVQICLSNGTFCSATASGANVTGSGTTNYVSKWTSDTELGNSVIYDDGTNVGIGTSAPNASLEVSGTNGQILIEGSGYRVNPTGFVLGQYTSTIGYIQAPADGVVEIWNDGTSAIVTFNDDRSSVFNGDVGIGVANPVNALEVSGTINATTDVCITGGNCLSTVSGDVAGPGSSTDNALVRFDGTGGKTLQNSGITIDDSNNMASVTTIDTGFGANELYDMDQHVLTTSDVTFNDLTVSNEATITKYTAVGAHYRFIEDVSLGNNKVRNLSFTENLTGYGHYTIKFRIQRSSDSSTAPVGYLEQIIMLQTDSDGRVSDNVSYTMEAFGTAPDSIKIGEVFQNSSNHLFIPIYSTSMGSNRVWMFDVEVTAPTTNIDVFKSHSFTSSQDDTFPGQSNQGTSNYFGVGTSSPAKPLEVVGDIQMLETDAVNPAALLNATGTFGELVLYREGVPVTKIAAESGGDSFFNSGGGVGIGVESPGELLEVAGNINSTGGDICITGGNCLSSAGGGINPWATGTGTIYNTTASVGIGTSTISQALTVSGSINVSENIYYGGNLTGYGADFAEKMTKAEDVLPGDVVCMNEVLSIVKCTQRAQQSVMGVVSEQPTIIGNADAPNSVPVGITGIVKTRVKGPVKQFEMLTTSTLAGYAERATINDFNAIIGKAMEPCEDVCEIKVLVGLR